MELLNNFGHFVRGLITRKNPLLTELREVAIFSDLSYQGLKMVSKALERRSYSEGEYVFEQSEPSEGMFVILSGGVEIFQKDEAGRVLKLAKLTVGDCIGEMALLDGTSRSASAVAVKQTELALLTRSDLFDIVEIRPQVGVKVMMYLSQTMAERLRRTNRAMKMASEQLARLESDAVELEGNPAPTEQGNYL